MKHRVHIPKKEIYRTTNQIYSFLRQQNSRIILKKLRCSGLYGYCDDESDDIIIDYRKALLPTIIHECLHKLHDEWNETRVMQYESKIVNSLSVRQIKTLIRIVAQNI